LTELRIQSVTPKHWPDNQRAGACKTRDASAEKARRLDCIVPPNFSLVKEKILPFDQEYLLRYNSAAQCERTTA
jgi:hypothetical protein